MATIIAGRVDQQDRVQEAIFRLEHAGFSHDHISTFYVNPPGQHDTYFEGGDRDKAPGAEHSDRGATAGSAATPLTGPAGGALVGTLSHMNEAEATPPIRRSGMLVAVETADDADQTRAIDALGAVGAVDIERADGAIVDGDWRDFDPLSTPVFVEQQAEQRA